MSTQPPPRTGRGRFRIIAHRGDSEHFPENTLPAFEAAIAAGADMIELDIALAANGVFVVIHDDTLSRTTTGDGFVAHLPSNRIAELDAGHWFRPGEGAWLGGRSRPPRRKAGAKAGAPAHTDIRVPTLEQALETIGKRVPINIEIKPFFTLTQSGRMQAALARLVTQIHERRLTGSILLSSSNVYMLEYCRELSGDVQLGMIYHRPFTDFDPVFVARTFGITSVHPYHRQVNERFLEVLHDAGLKVYPYTVNNRERLIELRDLGVDGVFTDDPAAARRALSGESGRIRRVPPRSRSSG